MGQRITSNGNSPVVWKHGAMLAHEGCSLPFVTVGSYDGMLSLMRGTESPAKSSSGAFDQAVWWRKRTHNASAAQEFLRPDKALPLYMVASAFGGEGRGTRCAAVQLYR